jgi:hypothetical protein
VLEVHGSDLVSGSSVSLVCCSTASSVGWSGSRALSTVLSISDGFGVGLLSLWLQFDGGLVVLGVCGSGVGVLGLRDPAGT